MRNPVGDRFAIPHFCDDINIEALVVDVVFGFPNFMLNRLFGKIAGIGKRHISAGPDAVNDNAIASPLCGRFLRLCV